MANNRTDPAMKTALTLFERSGKTLEQVGEVMGYARDAAREAAWQFLHRTADPRLSMVRRFARAMGIDPKELL